MAIKFKEDLECVTTTAGNFICVGPLLFSSGKIKFWVVKPSDQTHFLFLVSSLSSFCQISLTHTKPLIYMHCKHATA